MSISKLVAMSKKVDLTDQIDDDTLIKIGNDVVSRAKEDDGSRDDWKKRSKDAMDLALQVLEEKSFPWPNSSNVKYPIVTTAALQFHSRIMPAILNGNKIAKAKVTGTDPDGMKEAAAVRVADFMNYQLIEDMEDWESDMDSMLLALSIEGCEFKKTYFSPDLGTNVSEWIRPDDLIVNYNTKKLSTCRRVTHRLRLCPQDIEEKVRGGVWRYVDLSISEDDKDAEKLQEFYEQHCLLDLDGDGYKEPYCVTVHVDSLKVVRVKANYYEEDIKVKVGGEIIPATDLLDYERGKIARIVRSEYFTKYSFIPSPDGGFYDMGLGHIAGPVNHAVSSVLNEIIDAGTLANTSGGFALDGTSVGNQRGPINWKMGEFKKIKTPGRMPIRDAMMPFQFSGPSAVLFNVLGLLIQSGKDITGVQDIHSGGVEHSETATTTLARIEEGQKVFNATFKRVYRGLTFELRKIYKLNSIYLEPQTYFRVLDSNEEGVVQLTDFKNDGTDVQPVGDPSMANTAQRIAKAEALFAQMENPFVNGREITKRYLEAIEVPDVDSVLIPEGDSPQVQQVKAEAEQMMQQMSAQMEQMQAALQDAEAKAQTAQQKAEADRMKIEVESFKAETDRMKLQLEEAVKNAEIADKQSKTQIEQFRAEVEQFRAETERFKVNTEVNDSPDEEMDIEAEAEMEAEDSLTG